MTRWIRRVVGGVVGAVMVAALVWNPGVAQASTSSYISFALPMAKATHNKYGVPTSVALAQSILETGWGASELAVNAKNYFGIKCTSVTSPYQKGCYSKESAEFYDNTWTTEVSLFRVFNTAGDSFLDYGRLLSGLSRYSSAMTVTNNPDEFIRRVAAAGYATDPNYASMIIGIMGKYNLYQYDATPPPPSSSTPTPAPTTSAPQPAPSTTAAPPPPTSTSAAPKPAPTSTSASAAPKSTSRTTKKASPTPAKTTSASASSVAPTSTATPETTPQPTTSQSAVAAIWRPAPTQAWRGIQRGERRMSYWSIGRHWWPMAE